MLSQAHIYIKGDVIGVGFRAWVKIQSKQFNIKGWVRNNLERPEVFGPNGGVEAVFQGTEEQVEKMIELMKKGSPVARVIEVDYFWQKPKETFQGFELRK